ncbi:GIY-YIG nuclease family protein [Daejeonella oryzae]|uniref:GIY-YIG nuclease family protein n=1 Tax=Daejeonella oryzae TaxID=1122943 RepID=UPI001FE08F50|nr:GIY-YIG nuclease family protein [Daejeonella oryzae]
MITNKNCTVLYIGVTNNLERRVYEHIQKINKGFTSKYNCNKLVWYEEYSTVKEAISREKQLKNWQRNWKNQLIEKKNPEWNDLSEKWFI